MADCVCQVKLKQIKHDGNYLGDDWTYTIRVNGEEKKIGGNGQNVDMDPPELWSVTLGPCGEPSVVSIQAVAVEEDLLFDDVGSAIRHIKQGAIPPGSDPVHQTNVAVRARVVESGLRWFNDGGTNFVDFMFDLEYRCV